VTSKTVLITGCSSGFGYGCVNAFLEQGFRVVATLRDADTRKELFRDLLNRYESHLYVASLDVTDGEERKSIANLLETKFGGQLDCLINNAGFGLFGALEDTSEAQIREQIEINLMGTVFLTRQLLPFIRAAKGRIINMSSVLGYMALPLSSMYAASKFAIEGFSESLRYELSSHGVKVCIVEPGGFRTRFADNQRWGEDAFNQNSAYRTQTDNYSAFQNKQRTGAGTPPDAVIKACVHLATARCPPFRVRCGNDAQMAYFLQCLLPSRFLDFLLNTMFDRVFHGRRGHD